MPFHPSLRVPLALALLAGCNEGSGAPPADAGAEAHTGEDAAEACTPGSTVACTCREGVTGAKVCKDNGQRYGSCTCAPGTDGGPSEDGSSEGDAEAAPCKDGTEVACDCSRYGVDGVVQVCEDGAYTACDCKAAPGAPGFSRSGGSYGSGRTFPCVDVYVERDTEVRYNLSHVQSPPLPGADASSGSHICDLDENGETWIKARLIKNGVLGPVEERHFVQRSMEPNLVSVSHDLVGTGYPGMSFQITAEGDPGLDVTAYIGTRYVTLLDPENDGTYVAQVDVQEGDLANGQSLIASGKDAVGQGASAAADTLLFLDGVGTDISGAQGGDVTWTAAGSPYLIQDDTAFGASSSLTLEPGTVISFLGDNSLRVDGALTAVGDACDVIRVIGKGTLRLTASAGDLAYDTSDETYVTGPRIEHLWGPKLTLVADQLYLRHSTLHTLGVSNSFSKLVHSYIGESRVQRMGAVSSSDSSWLDGSLISLQDSRIHDVEVGSAHLSMAYLGVIDDAEWGVRHSHFEQLHFGDAGNATVEQNTIERLVLHSEGLSHNILGGGGSDTLRVTFDSDPPDAGTQVDLSNNYWPGINATLQGAAAGYDAPEIDDYRNDISLPEVVFDPPLASAPADAMPRGTVGGEPVCM